METRSFSLWSASCQLVGICDSLSQASEDLTFASLGCVTTGMQLSKFSMPSRIPLCMAMDRYTVALMCQHINGLSLSRTLSDMEQFTA